MQTPDFRRVLAALCIGFSVSLTACHPAADTAYAHIQNPPLLDAHLKTVTLVNTDPDLGGRLQKAGYQLQEFPSNYPASVPVEANAWEVSERQAGAPAHWRAPQADGVDVRVLVGEGGSKRTDTDAATVALFYKNVLGSDVPQAPPGLIVSDKTRVQVWTFLIPSVVAAKKALLDSRIPVVFQPVAITTAYLGDHKLLGIKAPDGTVVELVETAAQ